jgi:CheY-like chemotaxis protein
MSVLIVEDEPLVRMDIAEEVAKAGFDVLDAGDASEALALLSAHADVSVMFTDINMPGPMNGIELARAVSERKPDVTVILTSAGERPTAEALPAGGRFVPKPYDPQRLVALLRDALLGRCLPDGLAAQNP